MRAQDVKNSLMGMPVIPDAALELQQGIVPGTKFIVAAVTATGGVVAASAYRLIFFPCGQYRLPKDAQLVKEWHHVQS